MKILFLDEKIKAVTNLFSTKTKINHHDVEIQLILAFYDCVLKQGSTQRKVNGEGWIENNAEHIKPIQNSDFVIIRIKDIDQLQITYLNLKTIASTCGFVLPPIIILGTQSEIEKLRSVSFKASYLVSLKITPEYGENSFLTFEDMKKIVRDDEEIHDIFRQHNFLKNYLSWAFFKEHPKTMLSLTAASVCAGVAAVAYYNGFNKSQ